MINKFEAVGIFASIACMVLALFLLRVESAPERIEDSVTKQAATVVVATEGTGTDSAVAQALNESVDRNGVLEKLIIDDVVIGTGDVVQEGDTVEVHYVGTLQNGQQFDNSHKRGQTFTFTIGEGRVIAGWEQGLLGMQAGGERILVIPSDLAYGSRNVGPIPANSTLIFAIELLKIN